MARKRQGHIVVLGTEPSIIPGFMQQNNRFGAGAALYAVCESVRSELEPLGIPLQYYPVSETDTGERKAKILIEGIESGYPFFGSSANLEKTGKKTFK